MEFIENLKYKKLKLIIHNFLIFLFRKILLNSSCRTFKDKKNKNKVILGYIPKKAKGWILEYLFRDLAKYTSNYDFVLCNSFLDLYKSLSLYKDFHIFSLHQSYVKRLILFLIPPNKITTFYTHSRLNINLNFLNHVNKILPMNTFEYNLLKLEGVNKNKIKIFYAGYDHNLFFPLYKKNKKFDVVFACKFDNNLNGYYGTRKNYIFLIELINKLLNSKIRVVLLGKGWLESNILKNSSRLTILDIPHNEFINIYNDSKLFVNVSLYEGGPVSWLEALACGCVTISFPTGFPADLISDEMKSYVLSSSTNVFNFEKFILNKLKNYNLIDESVMKLRMEFLNKAKFKTLTTYLEKIADSKI